jgi:hypothetical protein
MAKLTAKTRNALPNSAFAGPGRSYPDYDRGHAKAALGRVQEFGTKELKERVTRDVHRKYPDMGK